jgi:hypothetical protein
VRRFQEDELTIEVDERVDGSLVLTWLGRSVSRSPASLLHPWFEDAFALARERKLRLDLHFEQLSHFNSSTIAVLIQLINSAQSRGLSLTVRYDGGLRWQALSFDALKRALRPFPDSAATVEFVSTR